MPAQKIICLEFNELCPELLTRWMEEGALPNFKKFYDGSEVLTAVADEPGPDNLEPWIQWYSMHTGLPYREHGVQNLTDGPTKAHADVWRLLADKGLRVASCGSMNTPGVKAPGALFVPDPWCTNQQAYPAQWNAYHKLVAGMVQDSTREEKESLTWRDYLRFLQFVVTHGLSARTVKRIAAQIFSDTVRRQPTSWRRASLLDKVQFDVFRSYWKRERPDFASFFLNSTAHYQHAYWHCTFPEQFSEKPDPADVRNYGSAILYGYQQMDELLGEFFKLEADGTMLMLCTALSQQSVGSSSRVYYRPKNIAALLTRLGYPPTEVLAVMSEQFNLRFADDATTRNASAALQKLRIGRDPLIYIGQSEPNTLFLGAAARSAVAEDAQIVGFSDGGSALFSEYFYKLPTTKATTHHPESLVWIKTGAHVVHEETVSILDWLPTILEYYGVATGRDGIRGRSYFHRDPGLRAA